MADGSTSLSPRWSKTCDRCRDRKVRCIIKPGAASCTSCSKRKTQCQFSKTRRLLKRAEKPVLGSHGTPLTPPPTYLHETDNLYIDHLLENPGAGGVSVHDECLFKVHDRHLSSSNIAFFSESRIQMLCRKLGNNKMRELIERAASIVDDRVCIHQSIPIAIPSREPFDVDSRTSSTYIKAYFDQIHPLYPFLDRADFEEKASPPTVTETLRSCAAFSALYYAVLALGCQYAGDGSFDPEKSESWRLFQVAMGFLPDVLLQKPTLLHLQAVTAMGIYTLNVACTSSETLILEAARMAQASGFHRVTARKAVDNDRLAAVRCRTTWVVYMLERQICFHVGRCPIIPDYDIGCPIPPTPESHVEGFDFFLAMLRLSRLCSRAYERLFATSATLNTLEQYLMAIDSVRDGLRRWHASIPENFRPGLPLTATDTRTAFMQLRLRYLYHALIMAVCRLELHVSTETPSLTQRNLADTKIELLGTARTVLQLTTHMDVRPYVPSWILGHVPLSAMFILFDVVVNNPNHSETEANLSHLNMAVGYFSRVDYATKGSLPASLLSGFVHLANQFVTEHRRPNGTLATPETIPHSPLEEQTSSLPGISSLQAEEPDVGGSNLDIAPIANPEELFFDFSYPLPTFDMDPMTGNDISAGTDFTYMFGTLAPDISNSMHW